MILTDLKCIFIRQIPQTSWKPPSSPPSNQFRAQVSPPRLFAWRPCRLWLVTHWQPKRTIVLDSQCDFFSLTMDLRFLILWGRKNHPQKNKGPSKSHFITSQPGYFDSSRGSQQCMHSAEKSARSVNVAELCNGSTPIVYYTIVFLIYYVILYIIIYHWDLLGVCTKCPNIIYCILKWDITYYIYIMMIWGGTSRYTTYFAVKATGLTDPWIRQSPQGQRICGITRNVSNWTLWASSHL